MLSVQIKLSRFPVTVLFFLTSGTGGHWAGHVAETPAPICCLLHVGSWWQAEETTELAQLLESQKARRHSALPHCHYLAAGGSIHVFLFILTYFYSLWALQHRVYPPKAEWGVRMCLCFPFHLRGSLCAWNFGARPRAWSQCVQEAELP